MKSKTMARARSDKHYRVKAIQLFVGLLLVCHSSVVLGFKSKEKRKLRRGGLMKEKALTQTWRKLGRDLSLGGGSGGGGKSGGKSGGASGSGSGSSGSGVGWTSDGYYGCLTLSNEELYEAWTYPGSVPGCDYVSHNGDGSTTTITAQSGSSSSSSSTGTSSQNSSNSSGSSAGTSQSSSSPSDSSAGTSSRSSSSSSGSSASTSSQNNSNYSTTSGSTSSASQTSSYNDASASGSSQTSSYNGTSTSGSSQGSSYNAASASDSSQGSSSYNDSSYSDQSSSSNNQGDGTYVNNASNSTQSDGAYESDGDGDSNAQAQSYSSYSEGNDYQSDAANGYNYNDDGGQVNYDDSEGSSNNDERDEAYDENYQGEQGNQGDYGNTQTTYAADYTNPYLAFNIKQCNSYNDLWVWDYAMSCEKSNCTCTFTEQLIEKKLLTCDDAADCPAGCNICTTCLNLAGCTDVAAAGSIFAQASTSGTFAAAFTLAVLLGACCFTFKQKRRRRDGGGLGEHLMDDNGGKVWMVPICYVESDESGKQVWLDAERGVVTKDENITESRKHKLNNHTNTMERSMRKLRPKSADEQTAKEISGMLGGFFARLRREYWRRKKRAEKNRDKEVEGDDHSVSTARLNEFSDTIFPDVLANLSMCDEAQRWPTSVSKKSQEKPSPKNGTGAEEVQKTSEEASQESKTDRSLFPDLLAQSAGGRPDNVPKKASEENPPRQSDRTVASQETSVVQTEPEDDDEVQSMDRDDSSSSEEESTVILPANNNDTGNSEPRLVDGVWLVPIDLNQFDDDGSLGQSGSSDQEDDDETSINAEASTICSSITDSYVTEVTKLALPPMRRPS